MDRVIVFRREVLPLSETFILGPVRALRRYQPHLFGLRRTPGLDITGIPCHTLGGRFGRMREVLFRYGGFGPSLYRAAAECSPALIHAHFGMDGAECWPLAERLGVPLIVSLHGWDVTVSDDVFRRTRRGRRYLGQLPELQKNASLFLCVSEFIRQQALSKGFPEEKLVVHYTGVDTEKLAPPPVENREAVVLFVGRLVEKKGLSHLLHAMAGAGPMCASAKLVVIGDGPSRERWEAESARLGIDCEFLGEQPSGAVLDWMRRALVLAAPSVRARTGDSEGLSTVVVEALALGLPVVAFSSAGIPEAIHSGCGLLANEGDETELGRQLALFLENRDLQERLAAGARKTAMQKFDLARQTAKLEQIYDRVVLAHRAGNTPMEYAQ